LRRDLSGNYLNGTIPTELGELTALTSLYVLRNPAQNTFPVNDMTRYFQHRNFYFNDLTGSIPSELSNLVEVIELYARPIITTTTTTAPSLWPVSRD